jgi:hypothetical protein
MARNSGINGEAVRLAHFFRGQQFEHRRNDKAKPQRKRKRRVNGQLPKSYAACLKLRLYLRPRHRERAVSPLEALGIRRNTFPDKIGIGRAWAAAGVQQATGESARLKRSHMPQRGRCGGEHEKNRSDH